MRLGPVRAPPGVDDERHVDIGRGREAEQPLQVHLRRGRRDQVVAAHDVGRAVNPALCEGQIEGSIHMGLGYALTEELPCPDGMPASFKVASVTTPKVPSDPTKSRVRS
mgnify:CR=1 FL=1